MADVHEFNLRFDLTGGPGIGKSTVIEVLCSSGSHCLGDAARAIIRERRALGLPPRPRHRPSRWRSCAVRSPS